VVCRTCESQNNHAETSPPPSLLAYITLCSAVAACTEHDGEASTGGTGGSSSSGYTLTSENGEPAESGPESLQATPAPTAEGWQTSFFHPLSKLAKVKGKLPFVELHDSPGGRRYAMVDEIVVAEDGEVTQFCGVRALQVEALPLQPPETTPAITPAEKIGGHVSAQVAEALRDGDPLRPIVLTLRLAAPEARALTFDLEFDIAAGQISNATAFEAQRQKRLQSRANLIKALQLPVIAEVNALGGLVLYRCEQLACLSIELPATHVATLAQQVSVVRIDAPSPFEVEGKALADAVEGGHQFDLHLEPREDSPIPFDGGLNLPNSLADNLRFALLDARFNVTHPTFRDNAGPISRIAEHHVCALNNNVWSCPISPPLCADNQCGDDHATAVGGILFGDLFDNQIANQTPQQRRERSGLAREAVGYVYEIAGVQEAEAVALISAMDGVASRSPRAVIANMSAGHGAKFMNDLDKDVDPSYPDEWDHCNGIDALSLSANELFERGTLLIKSAGNSGGQNPAECTVTMPGSAIGVFTVGGENEPTGFSGINQVRNSPLINPTALDPKSGSSRGGSALNLERGRGRTIIDLVAYGFRRDLADGKWPGTFFGGGNMESLIGTSFAAPVVSAAAIALIDHHRRAISSAINDPSILFANLLLMGDRTREGGTKLLTTFDRGYGAGVLKLRRQDDIGLDRPFGLVSTAFCVGRSQAISFVLNDGQPIPSGADAIKAVIYWYDRRHEHPALLDIANFDLSLIELNPDLSEKLPALQESKSTRDNKERVLFSGIAGKRLKLKVSAVGGIDPNFIYGTCSVPGALRVALAALWEDSTRNNDLEGPFWFQDLNIPGQPWIGVEPEDLP